MRIPLLSVLTPLLLSVNACDRPANYEELKAEFADKVRASQGLIGHEVDFTSKTSTSCPMVILFLASATGSFTASRQK